MSTTAAGATPGTGARPDHRYPFGPVFEPYRLRRPGASGLNPREVGITFDGEPSGDGATPPASGQQPATPPATSSTPPPASGGEPQPDADGMTTDAGREALRREREARKAAEKELEELRGLSASDAEKAAKKAVDEATKARDDFWASRIRATETRSALRAAGLTNEKDLELAVNAPSLQALSVGDDGTVTGLADAVAAFKKDHPSLFTPAAPAGGTVTRGPQNGGTTDRPKTLQEAVAAAMAGSQT